MASFRLTRWRPEPARDVTLDGGDAWLAHGAEFATRVASEVVPVRTGRLRRSIAPLPVAGDAGQRRSGVWASAPYALWVEIGTPRSRARPYLRPAAQRLAEETPELLRELGRSRAGGRR